MPSRTSYLPHGVDPATLDIGTELMGSSRTITDAEIALLPAMMGAINALFHDEEAARRGPMGRRILYGPALLGISIAGTEHLLHDWVLGLVGSPTCVSAPRLGWETPSRRR